MEKHLEKSIKTNVERIGGKCWKFVCPNFTGVPDRIVLMPNGKMYFVETKWGPNVTTPRQKAVHGILRKLGFEVWVIKSRVQMDIFLTSLKADQKQFNEDKRD